MNDLMEDFEAVLSRPSLRDRAKTAKKAENERKAAELREEIVQLEGDATNYMRDVLQMTPGEMADVQMHSGKYNPERGFVSWKVDGLEFRARYRLDKVMEIKQHGLETKDIIYDLVPVFEVKAKTSWHECPTLEKLGSLL